MLYRRSELEQAGGIRALASEAGRGCRHDQDSCARAGLRVRLVDAPFEQPLGQRAARRGVAAASALGAAAARLVPRPGTCRKSSAGSVLAARRGAYVLAALQLPLAGTARTRRRLVRRRGDARARRRLASSRVLAARLDRARPHVAGALDRELARHRLCLARPPHAHRGIAKLHLTPR